MPLINPDLTEAIELGPIAPGTYPAKIVGCEFKTSAKGKPMVVPELEITVEGKARKRKAYLVISGPGAYGFEQILRACHFDAYADTLKDPTAPKSGFDTDQLVNQQLQVVIESEVRNDEGHVGELSDRIKTFLKQ